MRSHNKQTVKAMRHGKSASGRTQLVTGPCNIVIHLLAVTANATVFAQEAQRLRERAEDKSHNRKLSNAGFHVHHGLNK